MTYAIDTIGHITKPALDWCVANVGALPAFVGRYLGEITPAELAVLAMAKVPLGSIARRSGRVHLSLASGEADGANDARAYRELSRACAAAGCALAPQLFIDIEQSPVPTDTYLTGWMGQVAEVALACCYLPSPIWREHWLALESANRTQTCCGVWIASYPHGETPRQAGEAWGQRPSLPFDVPFLAWQCVGTTKEPPVWLDFSTVNPDWQVA